MLARKVRKVKWFESLMEKQNQNLLIASSLRCFLKNRMAVVKTTLQKPLELNSMRLQSEKALRLRLELQKEKVWV